MESHELTAADLADVRTVSDLAQVLRRLRRREARRYSGTMLTYRELAAKTGWSRGILGEYFGGKILPPTDRFDVLTGLLGASPAEQGALATARDQVEESRRPVAAVGGPPIPRQLPADVAGFTGRARPLAELDSLAQGGQRGSAVVISAVSGTAGVGKTALAVRFAHRVCALFPDGQLFVDLRGYAAARPAPAIEALAHFLRALAVAADRIPADAGRCRRHVPFAAGRPADAGDARQRRQRRTGPAAAARRAGLPRPRHQPGRAGRSGRPRRRAPPDLDVLTPDEAMELLARLIGPDRVAAEPDAARDTGGACAYLPLALRIAAANLTSQPHQTITGYVTELIRGDRLDGLDCSGTSRRRSGRRSTGRTPRCRPTRGRCSAG